MSDLLEHLVETTDEIGKEQVRISKLAEPTHAAVFADNVNWVQRLRDAVFGFTGKNGMSTKVEAHDKFITRLQAWLVLFPFIGTIAGGVFLNYVIPAVIEYFKR